MPTFRRPVRIQFVDTDASGRMHFASAFRYVEMVELEFFREIGFSYQEARKQMGMGFPRVHVECDYKAPLHAEDEAEVALRVAHVGRTSFVLEAEISRDGTPTTVVKQVIVAITETPKGPTPLPEKLATALRAWQEEG